MPKVWDDMLPLSNKGDDMIDLGNSTTALAKCRTCAAPEGMPHSFPWCITTGTSITPLATTMNVIGHKCKALEDYSAEELHEAFIAKMRSYGRSVVLHPDDVACPSGKSVVLGLEAAKQNSVALGTGHIAEPKVCRNGRESAKCHRFDTTGRYCEAHRY